MIRNRIPRFRNLQNLHVIPTASNIPLNSKPTPPEPELPAITILPDISSSNIEQKMFNQNEPKNKFNKAFKNKNKLEKQGESFAASQNQVENSDYHWYNPDYIDQEVYSHHPSKEIEDVESTPELPVEEDFEEVEVASVEADGKQEILVGFRASKLQYLSYKKKCFFKPKIYKFGSERTLVNCLNVQDNCSIDVDIVSEAEYEIEYDTDKDQSESQDQQIKVSKVAMKSVKSSQCSVINKEENTFPERNQESDNKNVDESPSRIYKICIEDNADISQGQSVIQSSLDTWKSHLIGLEYLIEIRDKSKVTYYCVLCSENLQVGEFPAISVINHVNGRKHMIRYLEKHFPSYGFKFDENSDYNVVSLQKICEEINGKKGFSYMCITNLDCYEKNEQKIKNIVQNASHIDEKSLKLEKTAFGKAVDDDTLNDVQDVVNGIVEKILASEENTVISKCEFIENFPKLKNEVSHISSSQVQTNSFNKTGQSNVHNESISKNNVKSPKSFAKYKGNNALSSYLKIKYAKAKFKGLKPLKKLSSITKRLTTENMDSREKEHIDSETSKLESTKPGEVVCDLINSNAIKTNLENKEKVLQKPTVHSKHCRKRILGRETTRLKVAAKASTKDEFISGISKKYVKYFPVYESGIQNSSREIDKVLRSNETTAVSMRKINPVRKITSVPNQKTSKQDSKSSFSRDSKNPYHRIIYKKRSEGSKHEIDIRMIRNSSSHWKAISRSSGSHVKSADSSYVLKSETTKLSASPLQRSPIKRIIRRQSKSPVKRIKSPLRLVHRSPVRKFSRSPVRKHSKSPYRRSSRSPHQKLSKSPPRRKSRSPYWKHSRSPLRKRSRSPIRRHSRSPFRRHSRSPLRRRSRSPLRRYSRSPMRRRSRSPLRRRSRSPVRRRSRSPWRRCSRSPIRRHSRSPIRHHSRSPVKRHRSPVRKHPRSSVSVSESSAKEYRSIYKVLSPNTSNIGHSGSDQDHNISKERFSKNIYDYSERMSQRDKKYTKVRESKNFRSFANDASDKHKSHAFGVNTMRGITDLDPVSDEDESIYFDKQQRVEDSITSSSSKIMLAQLLQKFSVSNVNPDDPSLNKLMLFMEAHSAEIQELMGSQSISKAGKINTNKIDSSVQEKSLFLQQYLLSNLAGSSQEPGLSSINLNTQPKYQQPPFLSESDVGYGLVPNVAAHNHIQSPLPRFFPPNVSVPPPNPYRPFNQPHQEFSPKSQVPPEVMFKDLKATVNKLFGANEGASKLEKNKPLVPGYVTVPDPEKWDLNHPDTPKFNAPTKFSSNMGSRFNAPISQKNVFHSQVKSDSFSGAPGSSVMRAEMPLMYNNNSNAPGQFFSGRGIDRPQGQNVAIPPPDAKVSFCDVPRGSSKGNLFPVVHNVNSNFSSPSSHGGISDVKVSLAQRLASVLVKVGMTDVPAPLLQEMLMKIGAFSSLPRQDITEAEIISILKRLGYLS